MLLTKPTLLELALLCLKHQETSGFALIHHHGKQKNMRVFVCTQAFVHARVCMHVCCVCVYACVCVYMCMCVCVYVCVCVYISLYYVITLPRLVHSSRADEDVSAV